MYLQVWINLFRGLLLWHRNFYLLLPLLLNLNHNKVLTCIQTTLKRGHQAMLVRSEETQRTPLKGTAYSYFIFTKLPHPHQKGLSKGTSSIQIHKVYVTLLSLSLFFFSLQVNGVLYLNRKIFFSWLKPKEVVFHFNLSPGCILLLLTSIVGTTASSLIQNISKV